MKGTKNAPTPRPNKRPRLGPSPGEVEEPKVAKKSSSKDKSQGAGDALATEFLQVMQPRSQKGPSWKDEEPAQEPVASSSTSANSADKPLKKSKKSKTQPDHVDGVTEDQEPVTATEPVSDLDWLKRHTKTAVADVETTEKAFEQSDDEPMQDDSDDVEQEVTSSNFGMLASTDVAPSRHMPNLSWTLYMRASCKHRDSSFEICRSRAPRMSYESFSSVTEMYLR